MYILIWHLYLLILNMLCQYILQSGIKRSKYHGLNTESMFHHLDHSRFFLIPCKRLSNFTGYQMACMVNFPVSFLESLRILVKYVLFCCLSCFTHQCTTRINHPRHLPASQFYLLLNWIWKNLFCLNLNLRVNICIWIKWLSLTKLLIKLFNLQ